MGRRTIVAGIIALTIALFVGTAASEASLPHPAVGHYVGREILSGRPFSFNLSRTGYIYDLTDDGYLFVVSIEVRNAQFHTFGWANKLWGWPCIEKNCIRGVWSSDTSVFGYLHFTGAESAYVANLVPPNP